MKIAKIETYTDSKNIKGVTLVKVITDTNHFGWGQISPYNSDISTSVLHRQVSPFAINEDISDLANLGNLLDRIYDKQHKFPGTYMCRALGGLDTAIWDLHGRLNEKPVCDLISNCKSKSIQVYGSSMKRDITPEKELERFQKLNDINGISAFKFRIGSEVGRNKDEWEGRTEKIITTMGKNLKNSKLLVDANSCYTPEKAIEVGKLLEDNGIIHYEEPCPYWEHEWTREVKEKLKIDVAGGEQDNNLTVFRKYIDEKVVNIIQPDILYLGGIERSLRVAKYAEENNMICTPHAANMSLITIFTLHFLAAINNAGPYLEYSIEGEDYYPWQNDIYHDYPVVDNGNLLISDKPGWGIEPNINWLENSKYQFFDGK